MSGRSFFRGASRGTETVPPETVLLLRQRVRELRPRSDAKLSVDAAEVHFDRLRRHEEVLRDLAVRLAVDGQTRDTQLARCQRVRAGEGSLARFRARCDELMKQLTRVRVLHGDGTDVRRLMDEGIAETDAIATITDDDATNLLAALLGKRYGAKKGIALFKRPDLIPLVESLGIDAAISPRLLTASAILKFVRRGRVVSVFELPESEAETLEVVVQAQTPAAGHSLKALGIPADALVGAIVRGEDVLVPRPDTALEVGDHVILLALPRAIPAVERLFGL